MKNLDQILSQKIQIQTAKHDHYTVSHLFENLVSKINPDHQNRV